MLSDKVKIDGRPMLVHLSREEYTNPLENFLRIIAYSNVRYDISVHYSTAAIRKGSFDGNYDLTHMNLPAVLPDNTPEAIPDPAESLEMEILHNLAQLPWKRYAVITGRPLLAHIDIIIKSVYLNLRHGFPIISHLIDRFRVSNESPTLEADIPLLVAEPKQNLPVHLIVLIPGLLTVSNDLMPLAESIRDEYPRPHYKVVVPRINDYRSGDGILNGAARLYSSIRDEIESSRANKISFVGECVGGLYSRCVIGMLYKEGVIPGLVEPIHFITVQTQHLGTSKYVNEWVSSRFLKSLMSITARELHLLDETSVSDQMTTNMLVCLTENDYIQPLHHFKSLVVYASVHPVQHAYFSTCALTGTDTPDVDLTPHTHARIVKIGNTKVELDSTEGKMLSSLDALPWKRFGIVPQKGITGPTHFWNIQPKHPLLLHLVHQLSIPTIEESNSTMSLQIEI
jgi:hypothetical protein